MTELNKRNIRRRRRRRRRFRMIIRISMVMLLSGILMVLFSKTIRSLPLFRSAKTINNVVFTQMLLTPNEYSRPQTQLNKVNGVVVHYTANPGTSAESNRNYFENLKDTKATSASSHFIIGLEGEIIQCIPLDEISYASNDRNNDSISIECCHPDESGKFNEKTYKSLVTLVSWICCEYNLKEKDILRHYDVNGKLCPLYYVKHEDAWEKFKKDVMDYIAKNAVEK